MTTYQKSSHYFRPLTLTGVFNAVATLQFLFRARQWVTVTLISLLILLSLGYSALTAAKTSIFYQMSGLDTALGKTENELARSRAAMVETLKGLDPAVSASLGEMQDVAANISYLRTTTAIADAPRPQP
ncbi:MAG: hypothetical protein HYT40_01905 [Candidatus Sungbacteria bacterium]|uniref:Uncharacterized protein n=1 Tax=Candidatus Sungiibacteriota bacterium TaxID=2750080 RepID=A0A931SBJ8_9BACT|nr:hypothetical protein [Candidatus Sungbacteria bacterium]